MDAIGAVRSGQGARPPRSARLSGWYRGVAGCLRGAYFGRVRVTGAALPPRPGPRLILASHRNGAIDGLQVQAAFPDASYLVSLQLLRNPALRLLFTGIPVVRPVDIERYGMDPERISDPVTAAVRHLAAGGDLVVFPEGTSDWGHAPAAYRPGAAKIWCRLREQGIEAQVITAGLFYSAPDRFRSIAEVRIGEPLTLPSPTGATAPGTEVSEADRDAWENAVYESMSAGLDDISPNCPSAEVFDLVQRAATAEARTGASFAEAFLSAQRQTVVSSARATLAPAEPVPRPPLKRFRVMRGCALALMWVCAPVLLAAYACGRQADARNTVTFFRMLGGAFAALVWVPLLVIAACFWPWLVTVGLVCAVIGWLLLGARRWQPDADPLATSYSPTPVTPRTHEGDRHA